MTPPTLGGVRRREPGWIALAAALVLACGGRRVTDATDGATDAISLDGAAPNDATRPDFDGPPLDSMPPVPDRACMRELVRQFSASAPCQATTRACIAAAMNRAEVESCIRADSGSCRMCLRQNLIACANVSGCQGAWDCYASCAATCANDDCIDTTCGALLDNVDTCVSEAAGCARAGDPCFLLLEDGGSPADTGGS